MLAMFNLILCSERLSDSSSLIWEIEGVGTVLGYWVGGWVEVG